MFLHGSKFLKMCVCAHVHEHPEQVPSEDRRGWRQSDPQKLELQVVASHQTPKPGNELGQQQEPWTAEHISSLGVSLDLGFAIPAELAGQ